MFELNFCFPIQDTENEIVPGGPDSGLQVSSHGTMQTIPLGDNVRDLCHHILFSVLFHLQKLPNYTWFSPFQRGKKRITLSPVPQAPT